MFQVGTGVLRPNPVAEEDVPDLDVLKVIDQCLLFDPLKRPTMDEVVNRLNASLDSCQQQLTVRMEQELRTFLEDHNVGAYYDNFVAIGVETKADLELVVTEDLTEMGMSRIKARKVLASLSAV